MTEESTEVASTSETESSRDPLRWRRPFGIGVVLALVAVVAIHYGWRSGSGPEQVVGAGSSAELPAFVDDVEAHVVALLSYTPGNVKKRLSIEGAHLSDEFADAFAKLTSTVIAPDASKYDVTVKAKAVSSGLSSIRDSEALVLVFVETTTTSKRLAEPRVDGARLRVSVVKVDGKWLISELDPV